MKTTVLARGLQKTNPNLIPEGASAHPDPNEVGLKASEMADVYSKSNMKQIFLEARPTYWGGLGGQMPIQESSEFAMCQCRDRMWVWL